MSQCSAKFLTVRDWSGKERERSRMSLTLIPSSANRYRDGGMASRDAGDLAGLILLMALAMPKGVMRM